MRKPRRIHRRVFAVLGASVLLAVVPLSTVVASPVNENTTQQTGGCDGIDPRQDPTTAKVCRELNDGAATAGAGVSTTRTTSEQSSSSDSYFEEPVLWAAALLAGIAGGLVAVIRRHRPAALS